jgi:hypothetical protein
MKRSVRVSPSSEIILIVLIDNPHSRGNIGYVVNVAGYVG